jgi:hypothetical protein
MDPQKRATVIIARPPFSGSAPVCIRSFLQLFQPPAPQKSLLAALPLKIYELPGWNAAITLYLNEYEKSIHLFKRVLAIRLLKPPAHRL